MTIIQENNVARTIRIYSFFDVDRSGKVRWTACELGYEIEESRIAVQAGLLPYEGKLADYMDALRARPAAVASRIFDSLS